MPGVTSSLQESSIKPLIIFYTLLAAGFRTLPFASLTTSTPLVSAMNLSKLMLWRKGNSSKTSPSEIPAEPPISKYADVDRANRRPSELDYPVPFYASGTIDLPIPSPLYRAKSLTTSHLRALAYASAYIRGIFHYKPTPIVTRKTIIVKAPFPMVMKYGTQIQLHEASALRFVAEKTSIPVPEVYCAFEHRGMKFILMEFVRGRRLRDVWDNTPPIGREELLFQLHQQFRELRSIPHPRPGAVCSAVIGPLYDRRIDLHGQRFGPFECEKDFNSFLRCGVTATSEIEVVANGYGSEKAREELATMIAIQNKENRKICFTHGDAHSGNFLIKGGKIVAWIDFEMAGFYPEHWEYTTAMTTGNSEGYHFRWWRKEVGNFLKEYPEELQGEVIRQDLINWRIREELPPAFRYPE
ncbi:hypothetical protein LAWI1_G004402 [Lachnellula willkommii]|uniref:Aminoglycoside phosphotransferase domain-containing protein n=1 Tax=Lachnellula willkommii TaxID=215461 RepID=A0A559MJJ9_9HELO|nr:hypothetical protein LAWI1_G004402 [Lachnellula willkommii]